MKKLLFMVLLCFLGVSAVQAQLGQTFPDLKGETLEGKPMRLPASVKGKFTLLGLAFSQKSEKALQTWFEPVYTRFMSDRSNAGLFADFAYDVNVVFVPMFTGANKVAAGPARQQARQQVDRDLHKHVLFYVGDLDPYQNQLSMKDKNEPYFFVLDEEGKIVYVTSGQYSENKMDQVEDILSELE